ncbi:MAG TPA: hypothetical protein VGS58_11220, partial [Candidatus Sulfopaludibacter sp.]|nr:hypothetical protein [Candidatus Sulfopaludibacter sp.]
RIRQPNASGSGDLPPEMPAVVRQGLHPDETRRPRSARAYSEALAEVMLRPSRLGNSLRRRTLFSAGATALTALAAWRIRDYLGSPDVPASQRIVECPGIYPEEQYGFRAAYDIHSVVTTNENNTGRDRRRIWSGDMGQFYHTLTRSQRAQAWRKGFRLSAELLPEEGLITVLVDLAGFGPRFDLVAVRGASGETLAGIVRQVAPLHEFDLYPAGNRTPRLTLVGLVMNPENGLASVSIDGRTVARAYAGHRQFQEGHGLIIAVGRNRSERAAGVYRNVRLEIFP